MVFILCAAILLLCVLSEKISACIGTPALIFFMLVGMLFGSDGLLQIPFSDYQLAEQICSAALIFIMFYGGFNLKWKAARTIAVKATCLSTLGVLLTVIISMVCIHLFLGLDWITGFLISAVLGSTDAASVFSILRQKKLNLKDRTAPLLEMESGSNDPIAYMLTLVGIMLFLKQPADGILIQIGLQIAVGLFAGWISSVITTRIMKMNDLISSELSVLFLTGMVLLCYGASQVLGGNAYLSVYLMGILVGNSSIPHKTSLIGFFDGLTSMAQILIFFLLGLLSFPSRMPQAIPLASMIFLILLFIARPLATFLILLPFGCSIRQCLLVSFAGLRGAASCVFAIMAISAGVIIRNNLFLIVFVVTLLSVGIQGSLLPWAARKLDMIDDKENVLMTFNDYAENPDISLLRLYIANDSEFVNQKISQLALPKGMLALMIQRDGERFVCKGDTLLQQGDSLILSAASYQSDDQLLEEITIHPGHEWINHRISELNLPENMLITLISRNGQSIIPSGKSRILENDVLTLFSSKRKKESDHPKRSTNLKTPNK
ncbi:potassium/proton antiporter [Ileibacterium valens]|uniref:potassium/proton antiporter n=1 Tax=Ileibacterium valens TaxID=1862668 RepID=UPI00272D72B2|nr:potassium/proton antiporter [Ileibacterium valens]